MTGPVDYDEFGLFHQNAAEYGLPFDRPPMVRRAFAGVPGGRRLSALVWHEEECIGREDRWRGVCRG